MTLIRPCADCDVRPADHGSARCHYCRHGVSDLEPLDRDEYVPDDDEPEQDDEPEVEEDLQEDDDDEPEPEQDDETAVLLAEIRAHVRAVKLGMIVPQEW